MVTKRQKYLDKLKCLKVSCKRINKAKSSKKLATKK